MLLTGGGHVDFSSGLETIIHHARERKKKVLASLNGWYGIQEGGEFVVDISDYPIDNLRDIGGSFIGSSRTKPDIQRVAKNIKRYGVSALIVFGGEDTLGVAKRLHGEFKVPVVGWPKTMDNDAAGNYATVGYATAAHYAATGTSEAFRAAHTHSRIMLVPVFGRNYDWIAAAASDYGHADYIVPAERKDLDIGDVARNIQETYENNRDKSTHPFAVVVVSEAAVEIKGLKHFIEKLLPAEKIKYDNFGHPKLEPEILALAMKDAISQIGGIDYSDVGIKPLTYHMRDPNLIPIDEKFAVKTAEECVRLIDAGNFGQVATIQDPDYSGKTPENPNLHINANGKLLYVGNMSLEDATKIRPVKGTGYFDYGQLKPTNELTKFLMPLLGEKKINPRDLLVPFKTAATVYAFSQQVDLSSPLIG